MRVKIHLLLMSSLPMVIGLPEAIVRVHLGRIYTLSCLRTGNASPVARWHREACPTRLTCGLPHETAGGQKPYTRESSARTISQVRSSIIQCTRLQRGCRRKELPQCGDPICRRHVMIDLSCPTNTILDDRGSDIDTRIHME